MVLLPTIGHMCVLILNRSLEICGLIRARFILQISPLELLVLSPGGRFASSKQVVIYYPLIMCEPHVRSKGTVQSEFMTDL